MRFGVERDFDFIAASFVRRASDVEEIRKVLAEYGGNDIGIIAKIENRGGVEQPGCHHRGADGIMWSGAIWESRFPPTGARRFKSG